MQNKGYLYEEFLYSVINNHELVCQILTELKFKSMVFWEMMPWGLVSRQLLVVQLVQHIHPCKAQ
jgi:hypothetical protein